ncbi:hypothetical protein C1H46_036879 [Malus baccata]|uniref:WAT1-related protein n=1 Tax=Malus baccata TaxID=106549 RepID=A0A540KTT8_MALBA|nr:hypothetical protein C1H46_036879 [Malus baccata]
MFSEPLINLIGPAKLLMSVILLQCGYTGQNVIARLALNQGMSHYVFLVYRMAIATVLISPFALILDRKSRPKMTFSILAKTMLLSLFDPVLDRNLFYMAMSYSTATFTSAMFNILPAIAFFMAMIFRLEKVNIRKLHSQAKVAGTTVAVGGAIILTLAFTLRSYPCELSLTAVTCFWGLVEAAVLALFMEQENPNPVWSIVYNLTSNFWHHFMGDLTVTTAIMGSLVLAEHMYLGSIFGAVVIFVGLYLVLWGKKKDKPPSHSLKSQNQAPDDEEMTTNQQQMGIGKLEQCGEMVVEGDSQVLLDALKLEKHPIGECSKRWRYMCSAKTKTHVLTCVGTLQENHSYELLRRTD